MTHGRFDATKVARACRAELDLHAAERNPDPDLTSKMHRLMLIEQLCHGLDTDSPGTFPQIAVSPEDFDLFADQFTGDVHD